MIIRKALHSKDFKTIERLAQEIIPEFYSDVLPYEHCLYFVRQFQSVSAIRQQVRNRFEYYLLTDGGDAFGYIGIQPDSTEGSLLISKLYIRRDKRGMGFGGESMDFLMDRAQATGSKTLRLTVNRENNGAILLYKRYGFDISKELVSSFDNGITVLDYEMKKELKTNKHISMHIRDAMAQDIKRIQYIRRAVNENILSTPELVTDAICREFITTRGKGWVVELDGNIQGFAIADLKENNIWALFVHPDYEKKGIGRKLHDTMLNWYFSQGKTYVWLGTEPSTRAEAFYRSSGWKEVGKHGRTEIKFVMTVDQWANQ